MDDDLKIMSLAFGASSPLLIADRDQVIIKVNEACVGLSGFSRSMLLGASLGTFYSITGNKFTPHVDDRFSQFLSVRGEADFVSGKTVRVNKQEVRIHFLETITVVRDDCGQVVNYVVNFQDVTGLVATEQALQESQQTYKSLIESMHDGVVLLDQNRVLDCNEQFARMLLRDKNTIIGRTMAEISVPVQADGASSGKKAAQVFKSVLGGRPGWIDWTVLRANGSPVELEVSLSPTTLNGQPVMLATARDVTSRKKIERERQELLDGLAEKEELIRLAGQASGVVSWLLDVRTGLITWSDGAAEALGFQADDLGSTIDEVKSNMGPDQAVELARLLDLAVASGEPIKFTSPRRVGSGESATVRWFSTHGQAEFNGGGEAVTIRGSFSDVTDHKVAQQEIERLAFYDPLTGLANRRLLLDRLRQCCTQAVRRGTSGALLFLDLDRFKLLNDSLGHRTGDALLKEVAQRLKDSLREEDTVARLGGDEFVVLVPHVEGDATQIAGRVRRIADVLRDHLSRNYHVNEHSYHMSASIGAAIFPQDSNDADNILQQADAAMYLAKKSGRDTVAFYHAKLQAEADIRLAMEQDLRGAIDKGQLALYFQPKIDANRDCAVIGAEALLRWLHPSGVVMPNTFIPVAEETGLIISIGRWVLETACDQIMCWNNFLVEGSINADGEDNKLGIAVNVSPVQFRHSSFVADVKSALYKRGMAPSLLTLEITEGTLIDNMEDTRVKLHELQELGVKMSIDDFGTGYSSLYYLKNLPLDEIKIDRTYVKDIIDDASDAAIVASIMAIAKNLGLRAVAEGVETAEQAEFLRLLDCNVHQGYLYAKPLPAAEFAATFLPSIVPP
tara:strand:+ start:12222 stop:14762 length:2541 start_codon:yes stop_codon:yes gene_type:complete